MEGIAGRRTPTQSAGGRQGSQEVTEQARQQTGKLARQARQQSTQLANRASEQIKSQLANQKHQAAQRMTPLQSALRETGQQLRNQGQGSVAEYADKSADQLERFSRYLRENEVDQILDEARGFARRRPGLFVGSAIALGFFASRFLKSSSEQGGSVEGNYTATSSGAMTYGTREPTTALPAGATSDREPPTAGQRLSDREKAHAEELPAEPAEPPTTRGSSS